MHAIYLVCVKCNQVINHRRLVKEYFAISHIKNNVPSSALLPPDTEELFCTEPRPPPQVGIVIVVVLHLV